MPVTDDNQLFNKKLNELSELLKKYPGLLSAKRHDECTAIHFAVDIGSLNIVKLLMAKGADINVENNNEETILHLAARAQKPNIELVKYLLENKEIKQKLEAKEKNGWTAIHVAAFSGNLDILKELIKQGADINAENNDKQTILHLAAGAQKPNKELVKYLLEHKEIKQRLKAKEKNAWTAMHISAFNGNLEILKELIKQGADINAENNAKQTILHLVAASKKPNIMLVKYLLENKEIKQKLEAKVKNGCTAIHIAAFYGNLGILKELIIQGAESMQKIMMKKRFCI